MSYYWHEVSHLRGQPQCLFVWLLMEMYRRLRVGVYGGQKAPEHMKDMPRIDAGYSLDAPDLLPAGCMVNVRVDAETCVPEIAHVERESQGTKQP